MHDGTRVEVDFSNTTEDGLVQVDAASSPAVNHNERVYAFDPERKRGHQAWVVAIRDGLILLHVDRPSESG